MKKTALLLCLFMVSVMMPQTVWATDGITLTGPQESPATEITVTTSSAGQVSSLVNAWTQGGGIKSNVTKITLVGKFNADDLSALGNKFNNVDNFTAVSEVDMTEAHFVKSASGLNSNSYQLFSNSEYAAAVSPTPTSGTKAIIGGTLWQWTANPNTWQALQDAPGGGVPVAYYENVAAMNGAVDSHNVGDYAKVPNGTPTYKYMQMSFTAANGNWEYLGTSVPEGDMHDYTDVNNTWLESQLDSKKNEPNLTNGYLIKVLRFFKLTESNGVRSWVHCNDLTERPLDRENGEGGSDIVYIGEVVGADINNLDPKQGVLGSYIRFNVYYRFSVDCQWTNEQPAQPNSFTVGGFAYDDRDNHKTYKNGEWVQMSDNSGYDYYQLTAGTAEWKQITYIEGELVEDVWRSKDSNGDKIGRYAVVGGDVRIWNGSWSNTDVSVTNYSDMTFDHWASTLTTATTSRYADETISDQIFKDCTHLTTVNYKSGNVTGLKDRTSSYPDLYVTIGKDVTKIDDNAFHASAALKSLTFDMDYAEGDASNGYPKPLVIGDAAFEDCNNLVKVNFPNRVIEIGKSAFKHVGNLTQNNENDESTGTLEITFERRSKDKDPSVSIPYDHDLIIGDDCFEQCYNLKKISLPVRLSSLGTGAFTDTKSLDSLVIREDDGEARLKTIPRDAFLRTGLKEVTIPRSVTLIESGAFQQCYYIEKITFQEQTTTPQEPLTIRTAAFGGGEESKYKLHDVNVKIHPTDRLLICEYDAFPFVSLVGQTNVSNTQEAILHFEDEDWDYYAGNWKIGLAFNQKNLNGLKDGYTGYRGTQQPTEANNGKVPGSEPANGWQQFFVTDREYDVVLNGNYLRTYSTPTPHLIPLIAGEDNKYVYDIYRINAFSDGWETRNDPQQAGDEYDRNKANSVQRTATAVQVDENVTINSLVRRFVPKQTGLLLKIHGNADDVYKIYQYYLDSDWATANPTQADKLNTMYTHNIDVNVPETANLLYPSCDDTNTRVVTEGETTVTKVVINPTIPYPIGDISNSPSDKYRVFGLYTEDNCFWRSEPNVEINQDMAYLKLPTSLFHWANESTGVGPSIPNAARIALMFEDDENESTGIETVVTTADHRIDGYYSIQGVRLSRPQRSGLYIHNGRKVFVK